MELFREEISWWFEHFENTPNIYSIRIKKPITIEMIEYGIYMRGIIKQINEAAKRVGEIYQSKGRDFSIDYIERSNRKIITKWIDYLTPFRNQIAAHRYTTGNGKFLQLGDVVSLLQGMSIHKISLCKNDLFDCHNNIVSWLNNRVNTNNLILVSKLKN